MVMPANPVSVHVAALANYVAAPSLAAPVAAAPVAAAPVAAAPVAAAPVEGERIEGDHIALVVRRAMPYAAGASLSTEATERAKSALGDDLPSSESEDQKRQKALLGLALAAIEKGIQGFEPLKSRIRGQIRLAGRLKFSGQMLTMVLSSTVVASIVTEKPHAITVLGFLTLGASLLAFVANGIPGGSSKFVDEFGEASAKYEEAAQLRDRLLVYAKTPSLFHDIDDRIKEADDLRLYLTERTEQWGLAG